MIYGYARVSSAGQAIDGNSLEAQSELLKANGAQKIFSDVYTGTKLHRPELDKLMDEIHPGDTLIVTEISRLSRTVTKLDRIARSVKGGIEIIDSLLAKDVSVNILNMGVMNNTPTGKLIRTVMLAFAEFERDMIVERTREGKKIASQRPDYKEGRKPTEYDRSLFDVLHEQVEKRILTVTDAAKQLGVTRQTWYRIAEQNR